MANKETCKHYREKNIEVCRQKDRERAKKKRDRLVEQGICYQCLEAPPVAGKKRCLDCISNDSKKAMANTRKRRKKWKEQGLCTDCGKNKPRYVTDRFGKTYSKYRCEECYIKRRNATLAKIKSGICVHCGDNPIHSGRICLQCKDKEKKRRDLVKNQVYQAYGGYICNCCGETEQAFLSIDHINNDGCKLRKVQGTGYKLYVWLKKNNYPEGYQVLCQNCQWGKRLYGECPHKLRRQLA